MKKVKFKNLKNNKSKNQKEWSIKKDTSGNLYIYSFDEKNVVRSIRLPISYMLKVLASN